MAPRQLDLFNQTSLSTVMRDIKGAMNQAVKESGKSREQVVDMMNELAARYGTRLNGRGGLSRETFEKWLNIEDDSRQPSIKGVVFFCAVLQTSTPLAAIVSLLGGEIIEGADISMLKWARKYHQAKELRKQMKQLEDEL
ncbi:hypothetical protein [Desulfopila inferna]|uniref:hypothetical protein n=1 Tax=Desulfopila inferna TaxID=468528 RepID=UPI0019625A34|nr:hypothetical protein [Desulfopila inferna]MBM9605939.1 hypothetical protein [Desulfopila inferna]